MPVVPSFCSLCILTAAPPSWLSSLSCERRVLSDHRIRTACGRIGAFLVRLRRPRESNVRRMNPVVRGLYVEQVERPCTDLASFVLRHLVLGVLLAILAFAVSASGFRHVYLHELVVSEGLSELRNL